MEYRTLGRPGVKMSPLLEMRLDDADRPKFDELVHPGNAVVDFHNSNPWMKAHITG